MTLDKTANMNMTPEITLEMKLDMTVEVSLDKI